MFDGLWTLEYEGDAYLFGGGIIVVQGQTIVGGDSWYFYVGSVQHQESALSAKVSVKAFISPASTVFGSDVREFVVELYANMVGEDLIKGHIQSQIAPGMSLPVTLIRRR